MKKRLLLFSVFASLPLIGFSQDVSNATTNPENVSVTIKSNQTMDDVTPTSNSFASSRVQPSTRRWTPYQFIKIGNTRYDLQTNASIGNRIVLHDDGTVSAVFTTSKDLDFRTRGTGYNYYNGSNWSPVSGQTGGIETTRVGWPSIGILSNGKEVTMAHDAADGGWIISKNSGKGKTDWTSKKVLDDGVHRPIWGRMAVSGMNVYLIGNYADSTSLTHVGVPTRNGVRGPMTYSRSTDGGDTWVDKHILLPGYDSSRYINSAGDRYSINAKDSIVAIVNGGLLQDLTLWKSMDYGVTFTKTIVDTFAYAPYSIDSLMLDTPYTSDGTNDVLIDNDGNVHVFYGLARVFDDDVSNETYSFYPAQQAIMYWNEVTAGYPKAIAAGSQFEDPNDDDSIYGIQVGTYQSLQRDNSGNQVMPTVNGNELTSVARLGNTSLVHMPSVGIAENGDIFCSFSAPMESEIDINFLNYRDIAVVFSEDNGATWSVPQNVTQRVEMEDEFGCIAKNVNEYVHLVFQSDAVPGTNLQNNADDYDNHPVADEGNDIYYAAIPVALLKENKLGPVSTIEVEKSGELFVVSQNQPNPFNGTTRIVTFLDNNSDVTIKVVNTVGQEVLINNYPNMQKGNNELIIDGSSLPSGIYFYSVTAGKNTITKRMIVE